MIKSGLSTHAFAYSRLTPEIINMIAEAGIETIELYMHKPHFSFDDPSAKKVIVKAIERNELSVNSIHCPFYRQIEDAYGGRWLNITSENESIRRESVEWIKRSLQIARDIKIGFAVIHFGDINDKQFDERLLINGAESLKEILEEAERVEIKLTLENIPNKIASCDVLRRFLVKYGFEKEIGICFDSGHAAMASELFDGVDMLNSLIRTVHLHDTVEKKDEHMPPGTGKINWSKLLSKLRNIRYNGALMLENKWNQSLEQTIVDAGKSSIYLKEIWHSILMEG
ncbi:MAG: sugar phosphate isomerase/epimerase [Acidobacteria bacterium]|nr:sugar phosphate isomerase/epimerase [Acidobacteriota bacterium]